MTAWSIERHAEARKRCDAATAGPWTSIGEHREDNPNGDDCVVDEAGNMVVHYTGAHNSFGPKECEANAHMIAESRSDLPDALDEIERLREGVLGLVENADRRGFTQLAGSLLVWLDTPGGEITFKDAE